MRLLCVLPDKAKGIRFSTFLSSEQIENQLELETNTDWGSPEYGDVSCKIWIYQEDQFEAAAEWLTKFQENPNASSFQNSHKKSPVIEVFPLGTEIQPQEEVIPLTKWDKQPIGNITYYLFIICCVLLGLSTLTTPTTPSEATQTNLSYIPAFSSPIDKTLLFDFPAAYVLLDKIVQAYGIEKVQNPETLPVEGQYLLKKLNNTPYWTGFYDKIVLHLQYPEASWNFNAPLFEKIRQGEIWRLFTPCLLHYDIFHLFFNMIWLLVLGKQMEQRIKKMRYVLFIVITAILTNTLQYLMGGANFLGFSGVLTAMLGFIWARKKYAAWEGYQLQTSTINFMAVFILFMFSIQFVSFLLETFSQSALPIGIANTAHLTGAISGILLGRLNYFSLQNQ